MALPKGCVRVGCALSLVFVIAGTLLSVVGVAAATDDPELLGFDLRPFDLLGLFEATSHELVLADYSGDDQGARITVALLTAEDAWALDDLSVAGASLTAGGRTVALTLAAPPELVDGQAPQVQLLLDQAPAALAGPWTVALDLKLSASSWGGLNSISTSLTSQLRITAEQRR